MAITPRHRLNRLSRVTYWNRALSFFGSFLVMFLLALERDWPWTSLAFPAAILLVYPHVLALAFRYLGARQRSEMRAMLFESLPLGMLVAWMDFFLWMSFTLLTATLLNNALIGGRRQFLFSLALFGIGVIAGGIITGWQLSPYGPFFIELLSMALLLSYTLMVAFVAHFQNRRLIATSREIEERNRIFQTLVEISTSSDLTSGVDEFINKALERVHVHYPGNGLGLVVRHAERSANFRFADFVGIEPVEQEAVLQALGQTPKPDDGVHAQVQINDITFHFLFMKGEIRGHEGAIIIRTETIHPVLYQSMDLFLDLLAATIENKLMALELKNAAERDPLTGVFNRGYLDAELAHAIRNRQQHPSMEFSVMLLDVIGLKEINDTYGHLAGDFYLQRTVERLRNICRSSDVLVRYGGDEFVILVHGSTLEGAQGLAERIHQSVIGQPAILGEDPEQAPCVPLQISIGLASSAETPPDQVLQAADEAMYENKKAWYRDRDKPPGERNQ